MEAADREEQQRIGKGSSVRRKPLSDVTNLIRKPHRRSTSFSQSKKPVTASDPAMPSIGSTQIQSLSQHQFTAPRDHHLLHTPRTPSPVTLSVAHAQKRRCMYNNDLVRDGNLEPLSGLKLNNKGKAVVDSSFVNLSKENEWMMVATPMNYEVNGSEISPESKSAKVPLPNNNKKRSGRSGSSPSKKSCKKNVLAQEFIDQQRAYFKEIDAYELEVEEADQVSSP